MDMARPFSRVLGVLTLALLPLGVRADSGAQLQTAPTAANATTAETPALNANVETVTERYGSGSVKIERQVTKDAAGNYVNHGTYTQYDTDGRVLKTGEYLYGKQQGKWTQNFAKDEGHLFSADRECDFVGPFVSEADFTDGLLHGAWTIKDRNGQNIVEWNFNQGEREGKWTWWHCNGQKRLEAGFKNGKLDGDVLEYHRDGQVTAKTTYVDGRHLSKSTGWYTLGQKHFEGCYLRVADMCEPTYDWWKGTVNTVAAKPNGPDLKHGTWTEWYRSGNKKTEGQFDHGVAIGRFTWWYENGQKQAEVEYQNGALNGTWITWHPNGLKESQAEYRDGDLVEKMRWDADGKLVEIRNQNAAPARQQVAKTTRTTRQVPAPTMRSR